MIKTLLNSNLSDIEKQLDEMNHEFMTNSRKNEGDGVTLASGLNGLMVGQLVFIRDVKNYSLLAKGVLYDINKDTMKIHIIDIKDFTHLISRPDHDEFYSFIGRIIEMNRMFILETITADETQIYSEIKAKAKVRKDAEIEFGEAILMSTIEKRQSPRININLPVSVFDDGDLKVKPRMIDNCYVRDLSISGCRLECRSKLDMNMVVSISMHMQDGDFYRAVGQIVRKIDETNYGVKFLAVSSIVSRRIDQAVHEYMNKINRDYKLNL